MLYGGPPATILMVKGVDDAHAKTGERLRLGRLANHLVIADGVEAGLVELMSMAADAPLHVPGPGLVVTDLDAADTERFLDAMRRAEGLDDVRVVALSDEIEQACGDGALQQVPRPASLFDITSAVNRMDEAFRFEVELVERPGWYETRMWMCHAIDPVPTGSEAIHLADELDLAADAAADAPAASTTAAVSGRSTSQG